MIVEQAARYRSGSLIALIAAGSMIIAFVMCHFVAAWLHIIDPSNLQSGILLFNTFAGSALFGLLAAAALVAALLLARRHLPRRVAVPVYAIIGLAIVACSLYGGSFSGSPAQPAAVTWTIIVSALIVATIGALGLQRVRAPRQDHT